MTTNLKIKFKHYLPILLLICFHSVSFSQITIQGKVIDGVFGGGFPGLNIKVKDQTISTDFDGLFTISCSLNDTLVFSHEGYVTKTYIVKKNKFVKIKLKRDKSIPPKDVTVIGHSWGYTIEGYVTATGCKKLPKVRVSNLNHGYKTKTNSDGHYSIYCLGGDTLVFSHTGYVTQKITCLNQETLNVRLPKAASIRVGLFEGPAFCPEEDTSINSLQQLTLNCRQALITALQQNDYQQMRILKDSLLELSSHTNMADYWILNYVFLWTQEYSFFCRDTSVFLSRSTDFNHSWFPNDCLEEVIRTKFKQEKAKLLDLLHQSTATPAEKELVQKWIELFSERIVPGDYYYNWMKKFKTRYSNYKNNSFFNLIEIFPRYDTIPKWQYGIASNTLFFTGNLGKLFKPKYGFGFEFGVSYKKVFFATTISGDFGKTNPNNATNDTIWSQIHYIPFSNFGLSIHWLAYQYHHLKISPRIAVTSLLIRDNAYPKSARNLRVTANYSIGVNASIYRIKEYEIQLRYSFEVSQLSLSNPAYSGTAHRIGLTWFFLHPNW